MVAQQEYKSCSSRFNRFHVKLRSLSKRDFRKGTTLPLNRLTGVNSVDARDTHELRNLEFKSILGTGSFGRIRLVRVKSSKATEKGVNQTYALKSISKKKILEKGIEQRILDEKDIMMELNHPFIVKFHCAMQDETDVHFLMEVLLGGELFTYLNNYTRFCEEWSHFYGASVVLAFSQMHAKKIVYRDLKPENLVLDRNGYVKIIDFGFAKKLDNVVDCKTYTFCGTGDYLAPEIILREGHDWAVDYWALGVLLYEITAGFVPFYGENKMELYEDILTGKFNFPDHFSYGLRRLIRKLLKQRPSERAGMSSRGIMDIVEHEWFREFKWNKLLSKELMVPIKPQVSGSEDLSNFLEFPESDFRDECPQWYPDL